MTIPKPIAERLLSRVTASPNGCWLWQGYHDHAGYGRLNIKGTPELAHRVAFRLLKGPIPEAMTVDHVCFVRDCVNPTHLRLLTVSENCANQRRAFKTHCYKGHEYTEANTYWHKAKPGQPRDKYRRCRTCVLEQQALKRIRVAA